MNRIGDLIVNPSDLLLGSVITPVGLGFRHLFLYHYSTLAN